MREPDLELLGGIIKARGGFGHREHLELAWNHLASESTAEAHQAVAAAIRHLARSHGEPDRYHETITRTWVHLVALHRAGSGAQNFEDFIAQNPRLLDGSLLASHYSRDRLASPEARSRWLQPDLRPVPGLR